MPLHTSAAAASTTFETLIAWASTCSDTQLVVVTLYLAALAACPSPRQICLPPAPTKGPCRSFRLAAHATCSHCQHLTSEGCAEGARPAGGNAMERLNRSSPWNASTDSHLLTRSQFSSSSDSVLKSSSLSFPRSSCLNLSMRAATSGACMQGGQRVQACLQGILFKACTCCSFPCSHTSWLPVVEAIMCSADLRGSQADHQTASGSQANHQTATVHQCMQLGVRHQIIYQGESTIHVPLTPRAHAMAAWVSQTQCLTMWKQSTSKAAYEWSKHGTAG